MGECVDGHPHWVCGVCVGKAYTDGTHAHEFKRTQTTELCVDGECDDCVPAVTHTTVVVVGTRVSSPVQRVRPPCACGM